MVDLTKLPHKWLALAANVLCVIGIAYVAARAVFWVEPPAATAPAGDAPRQGGPDAAERNGPDIERLLAMQLFGKPPAQAQPEPVEDLQETRLSLTLLGVFVGPRSTSSALIAERGRDTKRYAIGDRLPGNAKLVTIHSDRVVITRGGVRELIRFDDATKPFRPTTTMPGSAGASLSDAPSPERYAELPPPAALPPAQVFGGSAERLLARHWEKIENDPTKLLEELGVGVAGGGGEGYEIGDLASRAEFDHTGLQRGDRLVSVNGRAVGDPEMDRNRLQEMAAQGSLRLEIQRGSRRMFITVAL